MGRTAQRRLLQTRARLPIALEGWPFILAPAVLAEILALGGVLWAALIAFAAAVWAAYFFRDPQRITPPGDELVVAPADGRVVFAGLVEATPLGRGAARKVSVFMSLFDVHVNRMPVGGAVEELRYIPGAFLNASLNKASEKNERLILRLKTKKGLEVEVVQIAGLIARRIVCWARSGDEVEAGERFGLIRFGSRVDVYLPEDSRLAVEKGQGVKAGQSVLGWLP